MIDTNAACQAILLISTGTPGTPDSSTDSLSQTQHREQLAFLKAALLDCGLCHDTWISKNALIGVFPDVDSAFNVACSVQQACREQFHGSVLSGVRMLLDEKAGGISDAAASSQAGWVRELADQLMKQIPPGQIFATSAITAHLSAQSRAQLRLCLQDAVYADAGIQLCQVTCNEETVTRIAIPAQYQERTSDSPSLKLRWRENTLTLDSETPSLTIGRGDRSDIRIESELASRIHARLGFRESNFILTDQSTNGTYVLIDDDEEVYLHQEQIVLRGSGIISLGRLIRVGSGKLIYFTQT